jgi:RNA polymerase-binding transcription factor DksA
VSGAAPAPLSARLPAAELARLRRALLDRGQSIATKLATLLASPEPMTIVRALGLDLKPGARPEEILRAALEHVEKLRRWIEAEDDRYGRCRECGLELGLAALHEVPWADACAAHG